MKVLYASSLTAKGTESILDLRLQDNLSATEYQSCSSDLADIRVVAINSWITGWSLLLFQFCNRDYIILRSCFLWKVSLIGKKIKSVEHQLCAWNGENGITIICPTPVIMQPHAVYLCNAFWCDFTYKFSQFINNSLGQRLLWFCECTVFHRGLEGISY